MEAHSVPRAGGLSLPRSRRLLGPLGDDRLVEQIRRGNDAAFEVVYDRYSRGILSFCRHMLASTEEAEDAVQHTFIQAYDSIRKGDRELKLKAWLYTIARNRCLSILRARREQAAELEDLPTAGLSDEVLQRSELRDLLGDIRELPEDQRAALVLSEVADLSHSEIAAVVGCEASKVKSLVYQARSSLIESRNAREIPCHEIREQLATASGGVLRRGPLRRHLKHCAGCAEFRDEVRSQRKMLAAALPVVPTLALKHSALAAVGIGSGASGAAGGAAAGGGLAGLAGSSGIAKVAAVVALTGATVGGGVAVTKQVTSHGSDAGTQHAAPAGGNAPTAPAAAHGSGVGPAAQGQRHSQAAAHSRKHGASGSASRHGSSNTGAHGRHHGAGRANAHHSNPHAQGTPAPHGNAHGFSGDVPQSGGSRGSSQGGNSSNGRSSQGGRAYGNGSTAPGRSGSTGAPQGTRDGAQQGSGTSRTPESPAPSGSPASPATPNAVPGGLIPPGSVRGTEAVR